MTLWQGWPPSVASARLSVLLYTRMQMWPQVSGLCSPTFSLRLTNGASWGWNSQRKAGNKGVSSFPPGGLTLYCLVSRGDSTKFEHKSRRRISFIAHRYPLNVYLYLCAYINICMYTYVAWYEGTEAMWNTLSFRHSRRIPHWLPQKRGEDQKGSSFLCPGFCFYSCVQFVLEVG